MWWRGLIINRPRLEWAGAASQARCGQNSGNSSIKNSTPYMARADFSAGLALRPAMRRPLDRGVVGLAKSGRCDG